MDTHCFCNTKIWISQRTTQQDQFIKSIATLVWRKKLILCLKMWRLKSPVLYFCLVCDLIANKFICFDAKCLFAAFLGKKDCVNVGQHTSGCDGYTAQQSVEFFIILDCKSDVTRYNTALLVITSCISSEFQDFCAEVFENGGKVYRCTGSHSGGVLSLTQVTSDTTDGKLKTRLRRCGCWLLFSTTSFSFSCRRIKTAMKNNVRYFVKDYALYCRRSIRVTESSQHGLTRHDWSLF